MATEDTYVLYYTTATKQLRQCISRASAAVSAGPYVDDSDQPLVRPPDGAIDLSPFVDASGARYLLWKDVTAGTIDGSRLSADGQRLIGPTRTLLRADQAWEGGVVEGPTMVFAAGRHHLLYSANDWRTESYAIGRASCDGPLGPCTKPDPGPLVTSTEEWRGPGVAAVFADGAGHALAFHAWRDDEIGYPDGERALFVLDIAFSADRPAVAPD